VTPTQLAERCKESPYWAGRILCGFNKFNNDFHRSLSDWFVRKYEEGKRRFIIMTPRGHLKTSMFSISTILWLLSRNREERILQMMSSSTESEKTHSVINQVLTGELWSRVFPEKVPVPTDRSTPVTNDHTIIPRVGHYREGSLDSRAIKSRVTGGHYTTQIFDDLVDETIRDSPVEQDKVVYFLRAAEPLFVNSETDLRLIIGTRWEGVFYKWLLDESGLTEDYETLILGCFVDDRYRRFMSSLGKKVLLNDGDPVWPEEYSVQRLRNIEKPQGPIMFARQYLNVEVQDEDVRFRAEDFQDYRLSPDGDAVIYAVPPHTLDDPAHEPRSVKLKNLYITMTIDPATGEGSKTDESAITICGIDRKTGLIFVLDEWAGRVLPLHLINKIILLADRWKPALIAPEEAGYQSTLKHFLRQEMLRNGVHFPIKPVKAGAESKRARIIDGLQPFVANQQIYVRKQHKKLVDELVGIQIIAGKIAGRSPNRADSLAYHVQFWKSQLPQERKDDEIEWWDAERPEVIPAYGLQCYT